jgi:hypothetical protein
MARRNLEDRVVSAAETALAAQGYVTAIDVLVGIGWLDAIHVKRWGTGQLPDLEHLAQVDLSRIGDAIRLFGTWASGKRLIATETTPLARTPDRAELRFTKGGDPTIERAVRTRWVSPEMPKQKRRALEQQLDRPPELVVIQPLNREWKCHRCGGSGDLLIMEQPGPACLKCAGLDRLEYLAAGDAALTRLAKAKSAMHAVVVRFSRTRRRYERQGVLVESEALRVAERELRERGATR